MKAIIKSSNKKTMIVLRNVIHNRMMVITFACLFSNYEVAIEMILFPLLNEFLREHDVKGERIAI